MAPAILKTMSDALQKLDNEGKEYRKRFKRIEEKLGITYHDGSSSSSSSDDKDMIPPRRPEIQPEPEFVVEAITKKKGKGKEKKKKKEKQDRRAPRKPDDITTRRPHRGSRQLIRRTHSAIDPAPASDPAPAPLPAPINHESNFTRNSLSSGGPRRRHSARLQGLKIAVIDDDDEDNPNPSPYGKAVRQNGGEKESKSKRERTDETGGSPAKRPRRDNRRTR